MSLHLTKNGMKKRFIKQKQHRLAKIMKNNINENLLKV